MDDGDDFEATSCRMKAVFLFALTIGQSKVFPAQWVPMVVIHIGYLGFRMVS